MRGAAGEEQEKMRKTQRIIDKEIILGPQDPAVLQTEPPLDNS